MHELTARFAALILAASAAAPAILGARPVGPGEPPDADPAGSIEGVVVDDVTGEPIPGAVVTLVEVGRAEWTHEDGGFAFPNLSPGRYTLVAERLGYARTSAEVDVADGEVARVTITMSVSVLQLRGFVVTGAPGARPGERALRPTSVLSGQELARKLDATLAASLQREAGISAVSMGPATARPVIRGLGGDRVLLLEDGARVGDLSSSSPDHAVALEPISARRIEVVRGPAALLYGSNALGGVVNVIREDIPTTVVDGPHGTVTLQGQTVNRGWAAEATATDAFGALALRAELTGRGSGDLRTPLGGLENTGARTYNASAGAAWLGERGHIGASYRLHDSSYGIPPYGDAEHDHDEEEGEHAHHHEHGVRIESHRHALRAAGELTAGAGPFSNVRANGAFTHYEHREIEDDGSLGTGYSLATASAELIARHEGWGPFDAGAVGVRGEFRDLDPRGSLETPPSRAYDAAAFVVQEVDLSPFHLHFGARYDASRIVPDASGAAPDAPAARERTFGALSGSVGALYEVGGGVSLGASVARAFRTPDPNELFSRGPHLASYSYEVGNPDLGVETGTGVDLFARVVRPDLQGEVAAFRNRVRGYIYPRKTGEVSATGLPIYRYTGEDAVLTGAEGRIEAHLGRGVVVDATASYVRGSLMETGEPLPMIPPLQGMIEARYERPAFYLLAGATLAARQERVGEFETPTDGYVVFHAGAGYRIVAGGRTHVLTLRLDNLTDAVYRHHLSRIKELTPEAGRGASLLYRVSF